MEGVRTISFAEAIKGRALKPGTENSNHVKLDCDGLLDLVDLMVSLSGCKKVYAQHEIFRVMSSSDFPRDITVHRKPQRYNGQPVVLISFEDAIKFIKMVDGDEAKKNCAHFEEILRQRKIIEHKCQLISVSGIIKGRNPVIRVNLDRQIDIMDVARIMTGRNNKNPEELQYLLQPASVFDSSKFVVCGRRRFLSLQDTVIFIMVVKCAMSQETRVQLVNIIQSYFSDAPAALPAAYVPDPPVDNTPITVDQAVIAEADQVAIPCTVEEILVSKNDQADIGFKRRREELELQNMELEIQKKRDAIKPDRVRNLLVDYGHFCSDTTVKDERARLMLNDIYLNMILHVQKQTMVADGDPIGSETPPVYNTPVSISSVAASLGYKLTSKDAIRVGVEVKKNYMKLHGKPPLKHDQFVDGRVTPVNSYTDNDRPLIVEALRVLFSVSA
jgi:hypothetical protein